MHEQVTVVYSTIIIIVVVVVVVIVIVIVIMSALNLCMAWISFKFNNCLNFQFDTFTDSYLSHNMTSSKWVALQLN